MQKEIERLIDKMFADTSIDKRDTRDRLDAIYCKIEDLINVLDDEIGND